MTRTFVTRLGVFYDPRIEVAIAVHRLLENLDGAGECAYLVGPVGMRDLDAFGAVGDLLDGRGDHGKRAGDRTGDDQHTDHDRRQSENSETGEHEGQAVVRIG